MNPIKASPTMGPTTAPAIQALLSFFSVFSSRFATGVGAPGGPVGDADAEPELYSELLADGSTRSLARGPRLRIHSTYVEKMSPLLAYYGNSSSSMSLYHS